MAGVVLILRGCRDEESVKKRAKGDEERERERERQLSLLAFLVAAIRRSVVACRAAEQRGVEAAPGMALGHMEIGWPTDVQHVSHVTFDRFHGFVGLPVEFEVEIPCRVPSA
ncbi:rho GTPase-activating protein 2-like, partial [Dendrobium catenatum]